MRFRYLLLTATILTVLPALTHAGEVIETTNVTYSTVGKVDLQLNLVVPAKGDGPFPTVLAMHGGCWKSGDRKNLMPIARQLASEGFVVAVISYRLAPDDPFPAPVHDAKAAVRWLRANATKYQIDPDRIGAMGYSAGGHLALLLGTTEGNQDLEGVEKATESSRVQAVVSLYGPTDLPLLYTSQVVNKPRSLTRALTMSVFDDFLGGDPVKHAERYTLASPVTHVTKKAAPTLLIHGTEDEMVPIEQSIVFEKRMLEKGARVELKKLERAGHNFGTGWGGTAGKKADAATVEYLKQKLQGKVIVAARK